MVAMTGVKEEQGPHPLIKIGLSAAVGFERIGGGEEFRQ